MGETIRAQSYSLALRETHAGLTFSAELPASLVIVSLTRVERRGAVTSLLSSSPAPESGVMSAALSEQQAGHSGLTRHVDDVARSGLFPLGQAGLGTNSRHSKRETSWQTTRKAGPTLVGGKTRASDASGAERGGRRGLPDRVDPVGLSVAQESCERIG